MNFSDSLKNISLIGVGDVFAAGISAIFWIFLSSMILPEEYGEINYLISIATITSSLALIGTQNTLTVFIAKNKEIISTLFLISFLCSVVGIIVLFLIFNRIDIGLLLMGLVIFTHGISSNLGKKNFKKYTTYSLVQRSLMVIFSLFAYYYVGVDGIIYGIALSYFLYVKIFINEIKKPFWDLHLLKYNKNFVSTNYLLMLTNAIMTQVDKILIVPILGLAILGNSSLALQIIAILSIVPSIIFKFILPYSATNTQNQGLRKKSILLSCFLAGIGIFILPQIIPIFFEKYTETIQIIQIMSFVIIPVTINVFYHAKFLALENGKIPLFTGIISSTIMVTGMIILGTLYGITGVAITYVLAYSSGVVFSVYMAKKLHID